MYIATKNETEILKLLNESNSFSEKEIIEKICETAEAKIISSRKNKILNALEGCIAKGFAERADNNEYRITAEGKKQI